MIKFVLGPKGSGKTKWLIDGANKDKQEGHGNIVFIDTDDSHIFTLDHSVRLVNAIDFNIKDSRDLYGFICGIISKDYDIEKIYLDGIYEIIDFELKDFELLVERLSDICERFSVEILMGMNKAIREMPEPLRDQCVELKIEE